MNNMVSFLHPALKLVPVVQRLLVSASNIDNIEPYIYGNQENGHQGYAICFNSRVFSSCLPGIRHFDKKICNAK